MLSSQPNRKLQTFSKGPAVNLRSSACTCTSKSVPTDPPDPGEHLPSSFHSPPSLSFHQQDLLWFGLIDSFIQFQI